jgi:MFS family permease
MLRKVGSGKIRGGFLHAGITFSAGSSYLLFGYDQGVLGGLITEPSFLDIIGRPSPSFLGLIVALYNVGCLAGCVVAGMVGDKLGRKATIFWGCLIMVIGGVIQTAIYGSTQLIIGRIISGVGNGMRSILNPFSSLLADQILGMITSTVPMYVAECSPAKKRGRSVAIQMSIVIVRTLKARRRVAIGC